MTRKKELFSDEELKEWMGTFLKNFGHLREIAMALEGIRNELVVMNAFTRSWTKEFDAPKVEKHA